MSNGATILIDTHHIDEYSNYLPNDKLLSGVFITHQHTDHFSGLKYLYENGYRINVLIYSPYERRYNDSSVTLEEWNEFSGWRDKFAARGTKLYTPYRQDKFEKAYWNTGGIEFRIIGPNKAIAQSDTREIHDACLVILASLGDRKCLFTGDASDKNLNFIARTTNNYCDDILHASHHGSLNGADLDFIKGCSAEYTVISTKTGVFPNVPHRTALSRYDTYTSKIVYRTDQDGSIYWDF